MATATALPDTPELEHALKQELQHFETVQRKLESDKQKLQGARDQRAHFVAAIPHGRASDGDVTTVEAEIHRLEILIEGNTPILQKHRARVDELQTEIRRRQAEAARAAREREFANLKDQGNALATKMQELLVKLCTEDVPAFDAIRRRLAFEFPDLDGYAAAVQLVELFFKRPGPQEKFHNSEVHLARLERDGWGYATPFRRAAGEPMQFPLQLTVFHMQRMERTE